MMVSLHCRPSTWLLAALLLSGCSHAPSPEPIIVGHLAPLSGPDKAIGEHARRGIMLAVEEVNDGEKINGRRVEVYHADDRAGPTAAGDEAVRLIKVSRAVALLGGIGSERAEQIARAAQPDAVLLVTPSPLPAPQAGDNAFSTCPPPAELGRALALFAAEELKIKKAVVFLDSRSNVCTGIASAFAGEFATGGQRRVEQYRYDDSSGLADLPTRAANAKPDAVLIAAPAADFVKLREGLVKAGVEVPVLYGGEESAWPALLSDPGASRGVYAVTTFAVEGLTQRGQEFNKRYTERFHEAPDLYAADAYDGARLLFEAMRHAGSTEPKAIRDALPGVDGFESLTGPLTVDTESHGARRPLFVVRREEGEVKMLKRYDPSSR
jgi:branched-chain amino acid transport system substrate-binding protein